MKFKSPETHPNQIVWDSIQNKALCEFKNGELETEEERVIKILADLGYSYEDELPVENENKTDSELASGGIVEKSENVIIGENASETIVPLNEVKAAKNKDVK
jgi:hypothetical protein